MDLTMYIFKDVLTFVYLSELYKFGISKLGKFSDVRA